MLISVLAASEGPHVQWIENREQVLGERRGVVKQVEEREIIDETHF